MQLMQNAKINVNKVSMFPLLLMYLQKSITYYVLYHILYKKSILIMLFVVLNKGYSQSWIHRGF